MTAKAYEYTFPDCPLVRFSLGFLVCLCAGLKIQPFVRGRCKNPTSLAPFQKAPDTFSAAIWASPGEPLTSLRACVPCFVCVSGLLISILSRFILRTSQYIWCLRAVAHHQGAGVPGAA
eukprot:scaffold208394_cov22-Tisochrysis_lutea.AAC.1